jgi:hypothetical protein
MPEGKVGFDGRLGIRVIRRKPTLRQRISDWLLSLRRF